MRNLELQVIDKAVESHDHAHPDVDRASLLKRGLLLEYISLGWNIVEGAVAIFAGIVAGSIALIGFGADSFVESSSAAVIVWRIVSEQRNGADPIAGIAISGLMLREAREAWAGKDCCRI